MSTSADALRRLDRGRDGRPAAPVRVVHLGIGKVSFGAARLAENATAALSSIKGNKPTSVKSNYVKAIHLTTSMGPSITVETAAAN